MTTKPMMPEREADLLRAPGNLPGHWSYSQLNTYETCPQMFYLERLMKEPPLTINGGGIGGTAGHRSVEICEAEKLWEDDSNIDLMGELFVANFREATRVEQEKHPDTPIRWGGRKTKNFPDGENEYWWEGPAGGPLMMKRYAARRRDWAEQGMSVIEGGTEMRVMTEVPYTVEEPQIVDGEAVMVEVAKSKPIIAYIDIVLLVRIGPNGIERGIADWKFGSLMSCKPRQMVVYSYALKQSHDWDVTFGDIMWMRGKDVDTQVRRVEIPAELRDQVPAWYGEMAKSIDAGIFGPKPNTLCASCAVRDRCSWGRHISEKELSDE